MAPLSMRPIGTSLASAACASADIPSRASGGLTCQTFGRPALAPFLMRGDRRRGFGAFDQILDLQFALRALVAALDDHAGRAAPVGIFHLRLHAGGAEIDLGADVRRTQPAGE